MVRAEWITGNAVANSRELIGALTPHGKTLIERCALYIEVRLPALVASDPKKEPPRVLDYANSINVLSMALDLASMIEELCPPSLTRVEQDLFLDLLLEKTRKTLSAPMT